MHVDLPYGARRVPLEIPEGISAEVIRPNAVVLPDDETTVLTDALDHPIGAPRLEEIARSGQRAAILCDDISRPTPTDRVLPLIVARLNRAGVRDGDIQIVMALGSHRLMTEAEMRRKVGDVLWGRIAVVNSEFRDRARMVRYPGLVAGLEGASEIPGAPEIWIDRRVAEADIRIGVGGILPHPAAGWSGGAKIVLPGVAGEDTVAAFHLLQGLTPWNMFGTVDNPVRRAMESWVLSRVGLEFVVNLVFTPEGAIFRAVAGHAIEAHRQGVAHARQVFCGRISRPADIVVVTSYPADADLWQGAKGLLAADLAARDGATTILVSPCAEGVGPHPQYLEFLTAGSPEALLEQAGQLPAAMRLPLAVAAATLRIRCRLRIGVVSDGLSPEQIRHARMTPYPTPQAGLNDALDRHGPGAHVAVITHGGESVPALCPNGG